MIRTRWSRLFIGIVMFAALALAWAWVVTAQQPDPRDGLPPRVRPSFSGIEPASTAPQVALGAPGFSLRYVSSVGTSEEAYETDTQHLNKPSGLFTDSGDNLYVIENYGARLLRYNSSLSNTLVIGKAGYHGIEKDRNTFYRPTDVVLDSGGRLWVADRHRVSQFEANGNLLQTFPTWANQPWRGDSDNGHFSDPWGLTFDHSGRLFVADTGNSRVQVFTLPAGALVYSMTMGATGQSGSDNGHFADPVKVAVDSANRIYVVDRGNQRVQRCTISGNSWSCVTIFGVTGVKGTDLSHLDLPTGIHIDASDNVFIADSRNHRVLKCNTSGVCAAFCGTAGLAGSDNTHLNEPLDVTTDSAGSVYVADWHNHRVQKFNSGGGFVITLGATLVPYVADSERYNAPSGIAIGGDGSLFFTEMLGFRLNKLDGAGASQWAAGTAGLDADAGGLFGTYFNSDGGPMGNIALDLSGFIYAGDTGRNEVRVYNPTGTLSVTFGTSGAGPGQFRSPRGVAVSPVNGDLYVADRDNQRVQIFDRDRHYKAQLGVTGVRGSDNSHFSSPAGVAVDSLGNIYVAEIDNHRVQVFNSSRMYQRTVGVSGQGGDDFSHLYGPRAVAVDASRRLYVADTWNSRIQVFNATGAYLTTIGGQWGPDAGKLRHPGGLAVDSGGNVFVADSDNHNIQKFSPGVDGWTQVNVNGFGNPYNQWVATLAPFAGKLYGGSDNPGGGQVWRWDSGGWTAASASGFGNLQNTQVSHLMSFKNRLYAGTYNQNGGAEIWRSSNGSTWTPVMNHGFGTPSSDIRVQRFAVFSDTLYAAVAPWSSGTIGPQIWRSTDGLSWTNVVTGGFGDLSNIAVTVEQLDGYLYAGTANLTTGGELWRSPTGDSGSWTQVNTDGFGSAGNNGVVSLGLFRGNLYAGTRNWWTGGQLWRSPDGTTWSQVFDGGLGGGADASWVESLVGFGGSFYAAILDASKGMGVWRSSDATHWVQINPDGFGDSNNTRAGNGNTAAVAFNNVLYLSTYNVANGGEVWQLNPVPISGLTATNDSPTPLGQATTLTATISAGNGDNYAWSFGTGATASGAVVSYTYPSVGIYQATVIATNSVSSLSAPTSVTVIGQSGVVPGQAYTLTYTDSQGLTTTVYVPAGAITESVSLVYTPQGAPSSVPPGLAFAGRSFDLDAYRGGVKLEGFTFAASVTVEVHYSNTGIGRVAEEISLTLDYWDGGAWTDAATTCSPTSAYERAPEANRLAVAVCHLSRFALFGPAKPIRPQAYLPIIVRDYQP